MGNHSSRQEQLEYELKQFFEKIMQQNTIEKSNIIQLSRKFDAFKRTNPEQYTTVANQAKRLIQSSNAVLLKGRAITKNWVNLKEVYKEFQELVPEESISTPTRTPTKVQSLRRSVEAEFSSVLSLDPIPKESVESLLKTLELLKSEDSCFDYIFRECKKVVFPKSVAKRFRKDIPRDEVKHIYDAYLY